MREKLIALGAFVVASLFWIGVVVLGQRLTRAWRASRSVAKVSELPETERARLGKAFRRRRNLAIGLALGPIALTLADLATGEHLGSWRTGNVPVLVLVFSGAWILALVQMALFVRCPLCGAAPEAFMDDGESTFSGRQRSKGLVLFPRSCARCGLEFASPRRP